MGSALGQMCSKCRDSRVVCKGGAVKAHGAQMVVLFFFFFNVINISALGLSCSMQDLFIAAHRLQSGQVQ